MRLFIKTNTPIYPTFRLLLLTACCNIAFTFSAFAQKYTFSHYDIEDGLVQSQVNKLSQDKSHALWMGTLGGACRFDGKNFTSFSKENGLINNFVYVVLCDSKNRVWFGTHTGIACLDGKKLLRYPSPPNIKRTWVTSIVEDGSGTIWLSMEGKLFKVNGRALQYVPIKPMEECLISNIAVNHAGVLYVTVYEQGVFSLNGTTWINSIIMPQQYKDLYIKQVLFDKFDHTKAYLLANNQIFAVKDNNITNITEPALANAKVNLLCFAQDAQGDLWIGSTSGAYYLKDGQLIHFDSGNGFSDIAVSDIFCDSDNNIWLATGGSGFYKYEGDAYVVFDQSQGLKSFQNVMGIVRDKQQRFWLATDGNGLIMYDGKNFKTINIPGATPYARKVQCIYNDRDGNIWIGTSLGGLWKFDGKTYSMIPGSELRIANAIAQEGDGTIWMAAPLGCFYYCNNALCHLEGVSGFISSLLPIGRDSMLIGTQSGVRLAVNKKLVPSFKLANLESSNIFCMLNYRNSVMFGTGDWGLFVWDKQRGTLKNYNVKNGLNSNSIYNLVADKNGIVWAGTGRGVNRIVPLANQTDYTILGSGKAKDIIAEANQNSILYADDKIWMGTTKGLIVYNTNSEMIKNSAPYMVIQSVKLFIQQNAKPVSDTLKNDYMLCEDACIPYNQNHLAISFLGIYLKNPGDVSYQYKLTGLDDKFCSPVKNTMVDYPSLPPGKYTFQVKAITGNGAVSGNTAQISFEITPPFYKTWLFTVFVLLFFVALGIAMQTYMHKRKLRSVKLIERMKREEKQKIRKQTAEDFHDDLGNKLTQITVLSDILTAKIDDEKIEQKKLVSQIKQNAEALYNGTKDILWALDPKSDNLYEILTHARHFGIELFQDTAIEFNFDAINPDLSKIKLPMEYSRNITLIFKELLNNVLKHAAATVVKVTNDIIEQQAVIILTDNGRGFDMQNAAMGHGIRNIENRAGRIGGQVTITTKPGEGTAVTLKFKIYA